MKVQTPKVFISYSHDSRSHKDWVRNLARRLQSNGVDIILDQWDVQPGDDVTAFVEKGLRQCDRVLIVCTANYIHKANSLKGGVGYERMIITGQVAKNLSTKKFIPIIRSGTRQIVPAFLGTRIYVDLRSKNIPTTQYDLLLRALLDFPRHRKPPLGVSPFFHSAEMSRAKRRGQGIALRSHSKVRGTNSKIDWNWKFHWHAGVHRYCGHKLYFVFLRLAHQVSLFKASILENINEVGLKDYMIFQVFSNTDLLIRLWTDEFSMQFLKKKFGTNADILSGHCQFFEIQELTHVPEVDKYPSDTVVERLLKSQPNLKKLKEIQNGHNRRGFEELRKVGLILDPSVRYAPRRIQVFVAIHGENPFTRGMLEQLEKLMHQMKPLFFNSTIYRSTDSFMRALLKGQVRSYYDVVRILEKITEVLSASNYSTQTMLVANGVRYQATEINFERAEEFIVDQRFNYEFPAITLEASRERRILRSQYHDASEVFGEDPLDVLKRLIRAKMSKSAADISSIVGSLFAPLEGAMKSCLGLLLSKIYERNANEVFDELKQKERVPIHTTMSNIVLGDLCKLYKNLVLEKELIEIAPLSKLDFGIMMDRAPTIRNRYLHEPKYPDEKEWDDLYSFFIKFVPIHTRLLAYLNTIQTKFA